ncbi:40S ribosomal protein S27-like isoform X1 [Cotesia glomerata]|uniref:40S ribosomal protein S27-like isoform X1 n=1 Tax=Cotesia glomerata TaxID=32391 RepID=UPI001D01D7AE|nr:40S ribosomal protein S27-like isoform X1 [Cotesia glomerata]
MFFIFTFCLLTLVLRLNKCTRTLTCPYFFSTLMPLAVDYLHPSPQEEKRKHKLKRLVQKPNSYFMDVKCPGCYAIKTIFSHAQRPVECDGCRTILCTPTGGKARLTEGCSFRRKVQC